MKICKLCLENIFDGEDYIEDDKGGFIHKTCQNEYDSMIENLEKIYKETSFGDI